MGKLDITRQWIRKHALGLIMLIGLFILSSWAVKHFKKPGQMTVIESQAMDMTAMKPPIGSVPVATEFAGTGEFRSKVRYTGSVVAYNEQNIYPRVDGWLTGLKVYNGDRVIAGQLLAVLDSPDIQNKLSEASYGQVAALQEIPIAQSNLTRMKAERNAARREIKVAHTEIAGAKASVVAAQKMVTGAEKELKSAEANLRYWQDEFKRQENLLKAGAVSRQEYDVEKSQLAAAEADVENKQAKIEEAQANVDVAKAELNNKQEQVKIASDRASAADAALSSASGEVSQKASMANMAGAQKATAASFNQYRMIRAPFNGVVTKRYLSPGVLVSPGKSDFRQTSQNRIWLISASAPMLLHICPKGKRPYIQLYHQYRHLLTQPAEQRL
ncbi:MAG: HlyD family secretion protein [Armatimonadota bacterium]